MTEENNLFATIKGELISHLTSSQIDIPSEILKIITPTVQKLVKDHMTPESSEKLNQIYKVIIKPSLEKGMVSGQFIKDKGSLIIRDKKTGQIAGQAKLENTITSSSDQLDLSTISQSIANIAGQVQLAEISQKLDVINEKIDLIGRHLWREKTSDLYGYKNGIEEAIESLPSEFAINRINNSIMELSKLADFFRDTMKDLLEEKIEYKLSNSFFDGIMFWDRSGKGDMEYNTKYNDKIISLISDYHFIIDLYIQTLGLMGTCYQIINEHHHASKYYRKINTVIDNSVSELSDKLIYLFEIHEITLDEKEPLKSIKSHLNNRALPESLITEIDITDSKIKNLNKMHEELVDQFENSQLTYEIDSNFLEEASE